MLILQETDLLKVRYSFLIKLFRIHFTFELIEDIYYFKKGIQ